MASCELPDKYKNKALTIQQVLAQPEAARAAMTLVEPAGEFKHVLWIRRDGDKFYYEYPLPAGVEVGLAGYDQPLPLCPLFRAQPFTGERENNPHHAAAENPERFGMSIGDLLNFLAWCNGDKDQLENIEGDEERIKEMCALNKEVYENAMKDYYHPPVCHNGNKMSWYKFNNAFTCNYTRDMAKGVALCFNREALNKNNMKTDGIAANCMISYAYDTDPAEFRNTLKALVVKVQRSGKLIEDGLFEKILEKSDNIFFCSFANYQANREVQYHRKGVTGVFPDAAKATTGFEMSPMRIEELHNPNGLNVWTQVANDPFSKVIGAIQKLVVLHTMDGQDIYERKWCCYEFAHAMKALSTKTVAYETAITQGKKDDDKEKPKPFKFYMVGSKQYYEVVKQTLLSTQEKYPDLYNLVMGVNGADVPQIDRFAYMCAQLGIATCTREEGKQIDIVPNGTGDEFTMHKNIIKYLKPIDSKFAKCNPKDEPKLNSGIACIRIVRSAPKEGGSYENISLASFDAVDFILTSMRRKWFNKIQRFPQHLINEAPVVELQYITKPGNADRARRGDYRRHTTDRINAMRNETSGIVPVDFDFQEGRGAAEAPPPEGGGAPPEVPQSQLMSVDISSRHHGSRAEFTKQLNQLTGAVRDLAYQVEELRAEVVNDRGSNKARQTNNRSKGTWV